MSNHTPGPWFHDSNGSIWRRDPKDLYQNGGTVAGDKPIAGVNKGWYHDGAVGYPVEANARLIASAPDLLEALEDAVARIDDMLASDDGQAWKEAAKSQIKFAKLIAKARGDA